MQSQLENFKQAGIGVIAITYDSPELQQPFIDAAAITYPILSDIDGSTARTLGILNEKFEPGHHAYGIPHPGVFVLSPDLEIFGKLFLESYEERVNGEDVLVYAQQVLGAQPLLE